MPSVIFCHKVSNANLCQRNGKEIQPLGIEYARFVPVNDIGN